MRISRYTGLLGAVALAVAGYLGGALPHADLRSTVPGILGYPRTAGAVVLYAAGVGLLSWAWLRLAGPARLGRAGSPARPGWEGLSVRWVLVTAGLWALPLLLAPPLASRDAYAYACQGATYAAGHSPYAEGVAALPCPWVDTVSFIWRDTPAPYGPGFVVLAGAAAALAGGSLLAALGWLRLIALAGALLIAWRAPALARACGTDPGRALWLGLAAPLVGIHLVSGAHNDGLMIGLVVAALAAATRARPGWRGVLVVGALLGLALAIKVTAVVVLPFAALLLAGPLRDPATTEAGTPAEAATPAGDEPGGRVQSRIGAPVGRVLGFGVGLAGVSAVVLWFVSLATTLGFGWVDGLVSSGDSRQWTSLPTGVGFAIDYLFLPAGHTAVPVTRALGIGVLGIVLVALFVRTAGWGGLPWGARQGRGAERPGPAGPRRTDPATPRRVVAAAGWALGCTVLLAPVFHPWYALWPLTLLAVADWRRWLGWVATGLAFLILPDGFNLARVTKLPGALLMAALAGVLLWRVLRTAVGTRVGLLRNR
ncbi:polyprenol phosphomannose-dependent alpha 1,6 mannosyltransferase MptB [Longispora fulva]|uniref:Alpha-1,6-mannosyltransferase n=1 Tax=Longispora fulva TaxID=619741 RepID=A0A8J7GCX8_9ACTN|nr:polyprenol phosphomannose-dependent alpha 1,6 mannosyltransferase MptB [Longispora fulva]MBG6138258.1 alpha-1,6-mannosyltransferase [Longispora fulva]